MYLSHWGLARSPFAAGAAPLLAYDGESAVEATARLRFVTRQSRPLAVLVGPRGVGKSLLVRRFVEQVRRQGRRAAWIHAAGLSSRELLWQMSAELALAPRGSEDAAALFRRLATFADALLWQRDSALVALDQADQAGPDVLAQIVRLLAVGASTAPLTFVLVAASDQLWRLGTELLERVDMRIDLEPWSEAETVGYVQHALVEAGGDRPVFDDEALAVLYTLSEGVPRQVNRLADHALLGAAGEGRAMGDAAIIEAAHDALAWTAPARE